MNNTYNPFLAVIFIMTFLLSFFNAGAQSGKVFYDLNNNQIQDPNELGYASLVVKVFPKGKEIKPENCLTIVKTDQNGNFTIPSTTSTEVRVLICESKDYCSDNSPKFKNFCMIADFHANSSNTNLLISHNPQYRRGGIVAH